MARNLRRWQVAALAAVSIVVLIGVAGYLAVPAAARWGLETVGARELGRTVRVESIGANPFTLRLTINGLTIDGQPGEPAPLLMVQQATVNAALSSVLRLAPVIDAVKVDGLTVNVVRLEPQRFNFDDIIERFRAKPKKEDEEPASFAVSNIEVTGSQVNLDDRVTGRKHALTEMAIGIPFISNLPVDSEVRVHPAFSAKLNGSPLAVTGETRPFHQTLESSLNLKLDGLDIPTYLAYSPVRLNFTVPRGSLDTDLRIVFRRAAPAAGDKPAVTAQTVLSGAVVVHQFALAAPAANAQQLLGWKSLRVTLDEVDPFARRAVIGDIALAGPTIELIRDEGGAINWVRFGRQPMLEAAKTATASTPVTSAAPARPPKPFALTLKHATVSEGIVNFLDNAVGSFRAQVVNLAAEASDLTTTSSARGKVRVTGDVADAHGSAKLEGEVGLAPVGGRLALEARDVRLRAAARYIAQVVNAELDGRSDVNATVEFAAAEPGMKIAVRDIGVRGKDIKLRGPAGSAANFDLAGMTIDGAELDLNTRQITIAKLSLDGPRAIVRRLKDGRINWLTIFRAKPGQASGASEEKESTAAAEPWRVLLKEAAIARGDLGLEDFAVDPTVKLRMSAITGTVGNVVSDGSERAQVTLRTRFGSGGTLAVNGGAGWNPLAANVRVFARSLDIAAVRPYLAARLNAVLTSALLSARGDVVVNQPSAKAPLKVAYKGTGRLANLHLLDAGGESDLLRQVLDLEQIDAKIGDAAPEVTLGKVLLSDLYARIIISEQGRLNLADLIKREDEPATELAPKPGSKPSPKPGARAKPVESAKPPPPSMPVDRDMAGNELTQTRAESGTARATLTQKPVDPSQPPPVIRIGQIEIARGNVNFTDNFIKPNYTANMTDLGGTVTSLASDAIEPATMKLAGMIDGDAPVDISGRLNPLAPTLFLDIEGRTKSVDLPRLTPYSLKYAGYPILKGKLSMEVKYKVENEKLTANNHLFLDQLTFGEKVDSPTATKLPVLLAVSLLKNSRGEIDINLPISGSLDDPKFSVGGIIIQVIVNLLTKIVTAPFALLASAFGGGEELGYVEFAPGSATLSAEQTKRVDTLAKALNDRPQLKLDIIGRVDPSVDTEGVRQSKLDAKLRAAKVRQAVRAGGESVDPSKITITELERLRWLQPSTRTRKFRTSRETFSDLRRRFRRRRCERCC